MEEASHTRLEVKASLAEIEEVAKAAGLSAQFFETDALTGDPSTVALVALVSTDILRAVQVFVSAMVKRDKRVEITVGKTCIKATSLADAEKLVVLLDEHLKSNGDRKKK